jgi:hypothetical protein
VKEFPDIEVNKVSYVGNRSLAKEAGVDSIPALVYGDKKLTGVLLGKGKIRKFLESI